ncbi:MAG: hypothetical protein ACYSWU_14275 [Planctomycetota bacterium]|jgi:hypothetical protein
MLKSADRMLVPGIWPAVLAAVLCATIGLADPGQAWAQWTTESGESPEDPTLDPGIIKVGSDSVGPGAPLILVEEDSVVLSATAKDYDRVLIGTDQVAEDHTDECWVHWSAGGGSFAPKTTTESEEATTFTAPTVPPGQSFISFSLTAKADDDEHANPEGDPPDSDDDPGGPLCGIEEGDRNDEPGTSVTITVIVVKQCPTTIYLGSTCFYPSNYANFWSTYYPAVKMYGLLYSKLVVSGGTPPNPPNNWNGLVITESVGLHPEDDGTAENSDFTGLTKAAICLGSSTFIVGQPGGYTHGSCTSPGADNAFWDFHGTQYGTLKFNEGPSKTVICQQKYFCAGTQLTRDGTNPATFEITRTYTNSTHSGNRVVEVATGKEQEE